MTIGADDDNNNGWAEDTLVEEECKGKTGVTTGRSVSRDLRRRSSKGRIFCTC